mmetsp:Transcript_504/g.1015  ORF Transcript_504/g.1015 Transcript_504/m.1015 type:complete len:255 (-) Transcript_504:189-953(-)
MTKMINALLLLAMMPNPSDALVPQGALYGKTAYMQYNQHRRSHPSNRCFRTQQASSLGPHQQRLKSAMSNFMTKDDYSEGDSEVDLNNRPSKIDATRPDKQFPAFLDAMLEIPDPRLLAGDLLFILIINFLLQIANEVGDPEFWMNGGFSQPVTMPVTLLAVMVRDSKMSLAWILGALWNRSYSSSSVSDDKTAVKNALQIWIDFCSVRILLELGESFLFTHSEINIWLLGREAWYTAIIMAFFRLAYSRVYRF